MNAITFLHDHRPVSTDHRIARGCATARGIVNEPHRHRPETVIDAADYLLTTGQPWERARLEATMAKAKDDLRRQAWCLGQQPVAARRWLTAENVVLVASASFAVGMMAYVLMGV